jgi:sorting and assembly machinery component 37
MPIPLHENTMLELHVWGPAFGLPSIDAHCLAAIAYLQQAVPRGKWQLVASSDPALSPTSTWSLLPNQ